MTAFETIINDLCKAYLSANYRELQKALKAYREAGYRVDVTLTSKKAVLLDEAIFVIDRYMNQGESGLPRTEVKAKKAKARHGKKKDTSEYDAWYENLKKEEAEQQKRQAEAQARRQAEQEEAQRKADQASKEYDAAFYTIACEWSSLLSSGMSTKHAYRKLAAKYHPDRGGSTVAMQALNNIMDSAEAFASI